MLAEHLQHGDARRHQLQHVVALELASGRDATEDGADVGQAATRDSGNVGDGGQRARHRVAVLHTRSSHHGCDARRIAQAIGGALHTLECGVHDRANGRCGVAQPLELLLAALDRDSALHPCADGGAHDGTHAEDRGTLDDRLPETAEEALTGLLARDVAVSDRLPERLLDIARHAPRGGDDREVSGSNLGSDADHPPGLVPPGAPFGCARRAIQLLFSC